MTGPCTLLAQPHYNRYIDAAGEHEMTWVGGSTGAGLMLDPTSVDQLKLDDMPAPAALSSHLGFADAWQAFIEPGSMAGYSDNLSTLTVTNGTKGAAYSSDPGYFAEVDDAFPVNMRMPLFGGGGLYGNAVARLTATGANLTATRVTLAGTPASGTVVAIVGNGASEPRTFQFMRAGVAIGDSVIVPANTIAMLSSSGFNGFAAAQAIGFKVIDSVSSERYLSVYIGFNTYTDEPSVVPLNAADISTTIEFVDLSGVDSVTPWAGTVGASVAMEGERYWRVAVDRSHFPSPVEGEIVSRWLPVGWPAFQYAAAFGLGRMGAYAYDTGDGYHAMAFYVGRHYDPSTGNMYWSWRWTDCGSAYPLDSASTSYAYTEGAPQISIPETPWDEFMVSSIAWTADTITLTHDGTVLDQPARQTTERDFPFFHIEPTAEGTADAVYLAPNQPMWNWERTRTLHRDVAVFSRNLTDAEHAFLDDDAAVWSYNMFAAPATATVTGLDAPMYRGDDRQVTITVLDADGDAVPLYGCSVWFTVKSAGDTRSDDLNALAQCTAVSGNDGTITGSGIAAGDISAGTLTATFTVPLGACKYDVQVKDVNGVICTIASGAFTGRGDVTRQSTVS